MRLCRQPSVEPVLSDWYFFMVNGPLARRERREMREHDPALAVARRTRAESAPRARLG